MTLVTEGMGEVFLFGTCSTQKMKTPRDLHLVGPLSCDEAPRARVPLSDFDGMDSKCVIWKRRRHDIDVVGTFIPNDISVIQLQYRFNVTCTRNPFCRIHDVDHVYCYHTVAVSLSRDDICMPGVIARS